MENVASCACGELTATIDGELTRTSVCHCLECQRRTGSAFGFQTRVDEARVLIKGKSTVFKRTGDSGGTASFHFCPKCGTTVFWYIDKLPGSIAVSCGALANPMLPAPAVMVYGNRKHHWIVMPELTEEYFG